MTVGFGNGAKSLLSGSVPDLQTHFPIVNKTTFGKQFSKSRVANTAQR
jgi:hypothetical protein